MNYDQMTREELILALKSIQAAENNNNNAHLAGEDRKSVAGVADEASAVDKFAVLSDISAAAVFIYQGTKNVFVNTAASDITGYSKSELLKMEFWEILHPEFRKMGKERGRARQKNETVPPKYDVKILTKIGEEKWLDFRSSLVIYNNKPAVLGTAFDITDRKKSDRRSVTIMADLERGIKERIKI